VSGSTPSRSPERGPSPAWLPGGLSFGLWAAAAGALAHVLHGFLPAGDRPLLAALGAAVTAAAAGALGLAARREERAGAEARRALQAERTRHGQALAGLHHDLADRRRAEEAIRSAEAQIELLSSRAPAGLFQLDACGEPVFANDQFCAMTGLPPDQLRGGGWLETIHPDDRERVKAEWARAWAAGRAFHSEFRMGQGELAALLPHLAVGPLIRRDPWGPVHGATTDDGRPVTVRGVGRWTDLTAGNQLASDRLGYLEIKVQGKGIVGDAVRRPNFLYRLLLGLLPF